MSVALLVPLLSTSGTGWHNYSQRREWAGQGLELRGSASPGGGKPLTRHSPATAHPTTDTQTLMHTALKIQEKPLKNKLIIKIFLDPLTEHKWPN